MHSEGYVPPFLRNVGTKINEKINTSKEDFKNEIIHIESKLEEIGYVINSVEISLTLPPRFSMEIDILHSVINKEIKEELLKDESKILKGIILALDNILKVENKMNFNNKVLSSVVIEGSLIPTVRLIYKKV